MPHYPEEVRDYVDMLNRICEKHGFTFCGMLMHVPERTMISIGNVSQLSDPKLLAELFRVYADLVEKAGEDGKVLKNKQLPPM